MGGSATSMSFSTAVVDPSVVEVEVPKKDILQPGLEFVNEEDRWGTMGR